MEAIFFGILFIIFSIFKFIGCVLYVIWKFELNPVTKIGKSGAHLDESLDHRLWDWLIYGGPRKPAFYSKPKEKFWYVKKYVKFV